MNDEQIIERCKAAGIKWIPPQQDEDDSGAFPGMFDMVTMSEMRALLAASASAEPEFSKVVPHDPTKEMLEAGREQLDRMGFVKDVWQAMYGAAKEPK